MKTGTLVLAMHSDIGEERAIAEKIKNHLLSKGRKNVFIGYHRGNPDCYEVFLEMNRQGVDTYCILPVLFSEGKQSVWNIPKHLTLPDNSGSWTMIGSHDVATRFCTALGFDERLAHSVSEDLGPSLKNHKAILLGYGSPLSVFGRTMSEYSEYLSESGWKNETVLVKNNSEPIENQFSANPGETIHVIPFAVSAKGKSIGGAIEKIRSSHDKCQIHKTIFEHGIVPEIMDSKVPEDW